jgi:hypothetical protein
VPDGRIREFRGTIGDAELHERVEQQSDGKLMPLENHLPPDLSYFKQTAHLPMRPDPQ